MESFNDVYSRMLDKYISLTGNTPSEESDIAIRLKLLAGEIVSCQMNLDYIKNQAFIETATGEYLDYHGGLRGLTRKSSLKAKGKVKFSVGTALTYDVTIPKGTIVATSGTNTVTFTTDEEEKIITGETEVEVNCTATEGGKKGNVIRSEINVLVDNIADIKWVKNSDAFKGGADTETDEQFRIRIKDTVKNVSNGTNTAYYKKLALSVDGVSSASVVALGRGAGTVDVYICSYAEEASEELVASVQVLMDEKREINTDVKVIAAKRIDDSFTVYVTPKTGYDFNSVEEKCQVAVKDYVNSLGVGGYFRRTELGDVIHHIDGVLSYVVHNTDIYTLADRFLYPSEVKIYRGSGK